MLGRRLHLHGLLAVLLALMAQLGVGASVPRIDFFAQILDGEAICHAAGEHGGGSPQPPVHPLDCFVCPFCLVAHTPSPTLIPEGGLVSPAGMVTVLRPELPPPSTAPPFYRWAPSQPRAPPIYS